jgi:membrane-bound lytic murein transglycosylase D
VPAFIAASYIMNYHEEHLITRAPLALPLVRDTLMVHEPVHLKQVSEVLQIPIAQLRDMNPQYRQDIVPGASKQGYAIAIHQEQVAAFIDLQDSIFAHKDSLYFDPGKKVASPQRYTASYRVDLPPDKYDKLSYTVKSGDNVGFIADWYDVRASDLRYWNNISRNLIRTGQKLVIYKPKGRSARYRELDQMSFAEKQQFAGRAVPSGSSASTTVTDDHAEYVTYRVRQGDSLWEIARKYPGVSETDISRLNEISNVNKIKPGQILKIKPKG